jgi:hypothetical protein
LVFVVLGDLYSDTPTHPVMKSFFFATSSCLILGRIQRKLRRSATGLRISVLAVALGLNARTPIFAAAGEPAAVDHVVELPAGLQVADLEIIATDSGPQKIFIRGLAHGGAVIVRVNDRLPLAMELLAAKGLTAGRADSAWITADLVKGKNRIRIEEKDGVQIVRVPDSSLWFGAASDSVKGPRFSVDFSQWQKLEHEYPFTVYHGAAGEEFLYFSGKFDWYYGESYTAEVDGISGGSGENEATLTYCARHPARGLRMPMQVTLVRSEVAGNFSLRVRQVLQAEGTPEWKDNVEFLHVVLNRGYGRDWSDGEPDWAWFRTGPEGNADAFGGSRTALARMRDWSARTYSFPSSTANPAERATSGVHHTAAAAPMNGVNAVGGWFSKKGSGSCGIIFHSYRASFRDDLRPLHSHCGDGADTHFYLFWGGLFSPLGMKKGDEIEIEYSLCFIPSELQMTDVMDINEVDINVFGDEEAQKSPLRRWVGTKDMAGLVRADGSMLLLGLAGGLGRFSLPSDFTANAKSVQRLSDAGRDTRTHARVENGFVTAAPGEFVIIDQGAALKPAGVQ